MITKERLQELIEKGATVYSKDTKMYGFLKYLELENKLEKLKFNQIGEVKLFITDNGWWHWFDLKDLFENKEDIEEIIEFGNITRTEKLPYVSWEKFKNKEGNYSFKVYPYDYYCYTDGRYVRIKQYYGSLDRIVFTKPLTRENYNESRRLCVKLFKGEADAI